MAQDIKVQLGKSLLTFNLKTVTTYILYYLKLNTLFHTQVIYYYLLRGVAETSKNYQGSTNLNSLRNFTVNAHENMKTEQ